MPRAKRAVQTPGAAPSDTADQAASASSAPDAPAETSNAPAAASPGKGKDKDAVPLTAADYATMHSSQVDAKTLTRSVLCKDGWVVPIAPPQPAQRA